MFMRRIIGAQSFKLLRNYAKDVRAVKSIKDEKSAETQPEPFTRSGDQGKTRTLNGELLDKDNKIFKAIGETEELLSYIGLAREYAVDSEHDYIHKLKRIQTVLIDITTAISKYGDPDIKRIPDTYTKELEEWIYGYSKELPPPELYIIPGGGIASASLHVARSICRRTERTIVPLIRNGGLDKEILVYLNRLSDFLFTLSRLAAKLDKRSESIYIAQTEEKLQVQ